MEDNTTMDEQVNAAKDKRDTVDFWRKWIASAKRAAEDHFNVSREAWKEYEAKETGDHYPIYWSSWMTTRPAYYSRTPRLINHRRFEVDDEDAATACLINTRLADYLVENANFDAVMMAAVDDFGHADKATTQVVYETELEDIPLYTQINPETGEEVYTDEEGNLFEGETADGEGGLVGKRPIEETQKIYLAPVIYREVLHTPEAKTQAEIKEMAFKFVKTREEAEKFFPDVDLGSIQWRKGRGREEDRRRDRVNTGEEYLEGWEIYSKPNGMVYWYSDQCRDRFLKTASDPQEFSDFFPCPPFIIGSKPSENLYPTPVYKRLAPQIETLTKQANKIYELMDAIDARALVDGSNTDLLELTEEGSARYIAVQNLASIVEKGGIGNLVHYLPTAELVNSLTTFMQANDAFKNDFYEHFGLPEVLRGVSDQVSTATEERLTASAGHDRFKFQKKQVRQLARDSIEMMLDLAYKVFSPAKIGRIVGFDYMDKEHKARFGNALAILKDDETRLIRIDIETDSMSFIDEQLRSQQTGRAIETFIAGLKNVSQTAKEDLPLARASLQALLESLESLGAPGQQFLETAKKTLENIISEAEKAAQNPSPPPPDPEQQKLQLEQQKLKTDYEYKSAQIQLENRKLALEERKEVVQEQLDQVKEVFQQQLDTALLQIEQQRVAIEQFSAQQQAYESQLEEVRLARETDLKTYQDAVIAASNTAPAEPQPPMIVQVPMPSLPAINLNVDATKSGKKIVRTMDDGMGGMISVSEDVPDPVLAVVP